ncbi:endonuclease/exonuclease/phosphatase family protein [Paracoccaceae bacterium GXU_MW_L88]
MLRTACLLALIATPALADLRVASFNAALNRQGPGLLLQDIESGEDAQIAAVIAVIVETQPDILLINELDWDAEGRALAAFQVALKEAGADYPHSFSAPSNTGVPTDLDVNGDGRLNDPDDAHGYGSFPGQYGMALLSKYPIDAEGARTFQLLTWQESGFAMPEDHYADEVAEILRLSSKSHWDVPVETSLGPLHILAAHPTPPVFDGPEDANGLRNAAEVGLWARYLSGDSLTDDAGDTAPMADAPFVILGDYNLDPKDGDGRSEVMAELLAHPKLQDPAPTSAGGKAAGQGGANDAHETDPALDTADWNDDAPGNMRVDYALPSADLTVSDAGVFWPADGPMAETAATASDHRLVWVDLATPE